MLPLRLVTCSARLARLHKLCNINTVHEFQRFTAYTQIPTFRLQSVTFYCTQIKKNDLAIKTVKGSELFQEALHKKKQQLHVKKLQIQEHIQDTRTKVREKVEEVQEHIQDTRTRVREKVEDTRTKVREKVEEVIERENIFTIPNWLCVGRIVMSPYLGYVIVQGDFSLGMGLMVIAGLTDLADGYIARNYKGQMSKFGSFLDPLADKCLMGTLVVSLAYCQLMPLWLAVTILFRDVFLIAAAFVIRYKSLPPTHRTLAQYFDATHVTAQLAPTFISKVNTAVQLFTVAATLGAPVWNYVDHPALHGLWYLTGATTAAAAISYIVKKDTYKYLRRELKRK
jgi:cardiolipin synthase (CMP-forming)